MVDLGSSSFPDEFSESYTCPKRVILSLTKFSLPSDTSTP